MDNPSDDQIIRRWEEEEKERDVQSQAGRPKKRPRRAIENANTSTARAFGALLDTEGEGFVVGEVDAESEATTAGSEAGRRKAGGRKARA